MSPRSAKVPTWEDTLPHFSVSEKGNRITARPLDETRIFGLVTTLTFVLWIPMSAFVARYVQGLTGHDKPTWWQVIPFALYAFVPVMFLGLTADEARDRIGQPATANRVAAIPVLGGAGAGLLIAAWWADDLKDLFAVAGVACWAGAGLAALSAWWGLRYIRKRQAWMAALRTSGTRSPGILREVTFRRRWAGSRPQFTVGVEYTAGFGPTWVTANMTTVPRRVPRPGAAVVVTGPPDDPTAEVLIQLDETAPDFDPDHAKYEQPTGN